MAMLDEDTGYGYIERATACARCQVELPKGTLQWFVRVKTPMMPASAWCYYCVACLREVAMKDRRH